MDTNKIFIDMAQRAHEFAEMCRLMQKIPDMPLTAEVKDALDEYAKRLGLPKEDPEAWREENRKKQAAGVKFECLQTIGNWIVGEWGFGGPKEIYREVPQEAPKVKEAGAGIPEASREILKGWQKQGLKFFDTGGSTNFFFVFDGEYSNYYIPEQPIPEGMSVETVEVMWRQGLTLESYRFGWRQVSAGFNWNISCTGAELLARLRIPAQPIPERLLEEPASSKGIAFAGGINSMDKNVHAAFPEAPNPPIPHAAERALWKAQREAGTNEVWQVLSGNGVADIRVDVEPNWLPRFIYRVKPMKLTARICMVGKAYPMSYIGQDWEFTGTREEYRAECEKYGYAVASEIKEVDKPKTVKHYFCMFKDCNGRIDAFAASSTERLQDLIKRVGCTIIGNIEEREVPIE